MAPQTYSSDALAKVPLVVAALSQEEVLADKTFPPGSEVSIGSNSGNTLVIPERFELTTYILIRRGCVLQLAPPLHVRASVWWENEVLTLQGAFRDIRKRHPGISDALPLASQTFLISYATGIAFMGRFLCEPS
jgi:hypothetical protein